MGPLPLLFVLKRGFLQGRKGKRKKTQTLENRRSPTICHTSKSFRSSIRPSSHARIFRSPSGLPRRVKFAFSAFGGAHQLESCRKASTASTVSTPGGEADTVGRKRKVGQLLNDSRTCILAYIKDSSCLTCFKYGPVGESSSHETTCWLKGFLIQCQLCLRLSARCVSSAIYSVAVSLTSLLQDLNTLNSTGDVVCLFAFTHVLGILPSFNTKEANLISYDLKAAVDY